MRTPRWESRSRWGWRAPGGVRGLETTPRNWSEHVRPAQAPKLPCQERHTISRAPKARTFVCMEMQTVISLDPGNLHLLMLPCSPVCAQMRQESGPRAVAPAGHCPAPAPGSHVALARGHPSHSWRQTDRCPCGRYSGFRAVGGGRNTRLRLRGATWPL